MPRERLIPMPLQGPVARVRQALGLTGREVVCVGVVAVSSAASWTFMFMGCQ